ncbi:MAG: aminoglycoside phosphotransferase, partial [Bacteroidales bacterium]
MGFFEAFTKGYLQQVKSIMNTKEEKYLYLAPKLMTYIIAIRFLTDYLNGDVYYKTAYDEHNLVRCEVQKKLIESMETKQDKMKQIIEDCIKTYAF